MFSRVRLLRDRALRWFEPSLGELEAEYRQHFLKADIAQATLGLGLLTAPAIFFVWSDYLLFGLTVPFALLILLRLLVVGSAVSIGLSMRRVTNYRVYDRLVLLWAMIGLLSISIVNMTRPPGYSQNFAMDAFMLLAAYLVIPARPRDRMLFGACITIGTAALYMTGRRVADPLTANIIWSTFILAHLTGITVARRLSVLRREQFAALIELQRTRDALQVMATTDSLTGLMNRRSLLEFARVRLDEARETGAPLTVIALDLDHFKQVNDNFGHAAGDGVLGACAKVLCDQTRRTDVVGRLGGEELAVVLPMTTLATAREVAERIRQTMHDLRLVVDGNDVRVTTSLGVAELLPEDDSADELFKRADRALYAAKRRGRNRVEAA
jgi:diguanylate cyclase (GGDEF)-like protein